MKTTVPVGTGLPPEVTTPDTRPTGRPPRAQPATTPRTTTNTGTTNDLHFIPGSRTGSALVGNGVHFAVRPRRQGLQDVQRRRVAEEPDRPVAHADVDPAGVLAGVGRVVGRERPRIVDGGLDLL